MKKDHKKNTTIILFIGGIILALYFWLSKLLFQVHEYSCGIYYSDQCTELAPTAWGFWLMTFILFILAAEVIFLIIRLNGLHNKTTTIRQSKIHALGFSAGITLTLALICGQIISAPWITTFRTIGIISISIVATILIIIIGTQIISGIEWIFNKIVQFNEWILRRIK